MTSHLAACPACSRHIRVTEPLCPFCSATLSEAFQSLPAPVAPRVRLARAALFALSAGASAVAPGCGGSTVGGETAVDAASDAVADAFHDTGPDVGRDLPPYGIPPMRDGGIVLPVDAGTDTGSSAPTDAGYVGLPDGASVAPYGIPPFGLPPDADLDG